VLEQEPGVTRIIGDPGGQVGLLLDLADGTRTVSQLARDLRLRCPDVGAEDVRAALAALDAAGLLEDVDARSCLTRSQRERYASNLAFFGIYATLERSRFHYQERMREAHVVLLGVGGLGCTLLPILAGLGVGRVTIVDCDTVALDNLTRQFLYSEAQVGLPKLGCAADRARSLNAEMELVAVPRRVRCPEDVAALLGDCSLVLSAIDDPAEVVYWVNEACVGARVPFITAATLVTRGIYYSVDPARSGCTGCWTGAQDAAAQPSSARVQRANRGTGPAVGLLGSLVGLEAMRYLTGFAPPVAAGRQWLVDLAGGEVAIGWEWERRPDCRVCAGPAAPADIATATAPGNVLAGSGR
jgi:molybdopterin/thiamine biosynthesis adenylyltransferase